MANTPLGSQLDAYDMQILSELSKEGRLPVTELASRVGLTKSPCQARLKRLQRDGFIKGFIAILDSEKMGIEHVSFTEVKLSDTREQALAAFLAAVLKIKEIEQCHMIAGSFDYLLKVRTTDIASYRLVLGEKISQLPHVANTSSFIAMQAVKDVDTRGLIDK